MSILTLIFRGLVKLLLKPASLLILLILVGLAGGYFYNEYRVTNNRLNEISGVNANQEAINAEIKDLVSKVNEIVELPAGEIPVIANIPTQEVLDSVKDQEFYLGALIGDKALIYPKAAKAFLYRPSTHKIINISPVTLNQQDEEIDQAPDLGSNDIPQEILDDITEDNQNIRIVFYNGTSVAGITTQAFDDIAQALPDVQFDVESRGDANSDYASTRIINLANSNFDTVQGIATALGGSVGNLPLGEEAPEADILVIVGSDYTQE